MGLALLSNVFLSLKLSPLGSLESIFKLLCSFIVIVLAAHRLRVGEIWVRGSRKYISPPAKSTRSLWTGSPDDRFMRPARAGGGGGGGSLGPAPSRGGQRHISRLSEDGIPASQSAALGRTTQSSPVVQPWEGT